MSKVGRKPVEKPRSTASGIGHRAGLRLVRLVLLWGLFGGCASPGRAPAAGGVAPSVESNEHQPTSAQLPIGSEDIRWGNAHAPVTVVAFLDFECLFCAQAHDTLIELLKEYGPKKIRLIVKHAPLPFHERGLPAARSVQAVYRSAGSDAFLAYVEQIFRHSGRLDDGSLASWANAVGVAPESYRKELAHPSTQMKVSEDLKLAQQVGVNGVPAFFVNGASIVGARPKADFVALIEHELRAGQELLRRGVAPSLVFAERVEVNWTERPSQLQPDEGVVYQVPIGTSPVLGPKTAAVTIVEFADFECPFCEQAHATVAKLMADNPGRIRWVMKHNPLPLHPLAQSAAITALEVRRLKGDAMYWQALQQFYQATALSTDVLADVAHQFGVPAEVLAKALDGGEASSQISADQDLAMDLDALGTPHFFVNGRRIAGAQPIAVFEQLLEREFEKAAALSPSVDEPYAVLQQHALPPPSLVKHDVPQPSAATPSLGPRDAPVVIQMFADFECAYCLRALPTLAELRAKYPGKIRLLWRHLPLPFHKNAKPAAAAALEAQAQLGPMGFWRMAEKLIAMPQAFSSDGGRVEFPRAQPNLKAEALLSSARALGLDEARFSAALAQGLHEPAIAADEQLARSLDLQGTPAFFIGGYALEGAQPLARFDRLVRKVLTESELN